jgi:SAM-dependent methyltransferase
MIDWDAYFRAMADMPVHPLLQAAESHLTGGQALDVGCGAGQAARFLAERGYDVTAIDLDPRAIDLTRQRCEGLPVTVVPGDIRDVSLLPVDLIHCGFVLFFLTRDDVARLMDRFHEILRPGGLFIGQFLGPQDTWAQGATPLLSHSKSEVDDLLADWEVVHLEEVERDGATAWGEAKHWHVTHVIAREERNVQ